MATRKAKANQLGSKLGLGCVVTWNAKSDSVHTFESVTAALAAAGLDKDVCRELLPRHAWARAAKKMEDGRLIDKVNETDTVLVFQFTKQYIDSAAESVDFKKETLVRLDKGTGQVRCDNEAIREIAQAEVDRATVERTTNDITKIVQTLFDANAMMFPIRDQGGAYFVPLEHVEFVRKIKTFLGQLGGSVRQYNVDASQESRESTAQAVAEKFEGLIKEHKAAVDAFTLNTRADTIEACAQRIRDTRVELEAYGHYLASKSKGLFSQVAASEKELAKKIAGLDKQRAELPADSGQNRLFGYHPTAVIRWMGAQGWKFSAAQAVLEHYGFSIADATIRTQLAAGRRGERGAPAKLSDDQMNGLREALPQDK